MKALYRKYRPRTLEDVVGQEQITELLRGSLKQNKLSHAYLFVGPRGCGKTSVARILAHEVNGFKYELEDDYIDIIEIDGASNRGIDNIRDLREKVMIAPTMGRYKVYIIDEVHMLTKEAFNALLKTLEEPPEHAIFIMATTDAYKVPVTITSRAQTFTFNLASHEVMLNYLKKIAKSEKIKIDDEAIGVIVKRGGGSFRDSLSLLDQISTLSEGKITAEMVNSAMGLPQDEQIDELLSFYSNGSVADIAMSLRRILSSGVKAETLTEEIIGRIISNPESQFIPLLSKLPEVKSPFAEARLLSALVSHLGDNSLSRVNPINAVTKKHPDMTPNELKQANTSSTATKSKPEQINANPTAISSKSKQDKEPNPTSPHSVRPNPANHEKIQKDGPTNIDVHFDWAEYLDRVKTLSDAVYSQLRKTKYELIGDVLHIYPGKRIIKSILTRSNNKQILTKVSEEIAVVVHEENEVPSSVQKDETLEKISAIMGGEVKNDSGGNPF